MSRQFRVYLLPSDADALVENLNARIGVRVLQERSSNFEPVQLISPVQSQLAKLDASKASSIRCYLTPTKDAFLRINFYEEQNNWVIQPGSEAIEFSGCDYDGTFLRIGRFYYQNDLLIDNDIVPKRREFIEWADQAFKIVKKTLQRSSSLDAYIGEDANRFHQNGGRFVRAIRSNGEPIFDEG